MTPTPPPDRGVPTVLAEAAEITDPADRVAYLDRACPDPVARREVERLLDLHFRAGSFLEPPSPDPDATAAFPPAAGGYAAGDRVGPYRLREPLGEGGMGSVWVADQAEPVKRWVAVKLVKPGMDTKEVLARFEQERQALALMDHPGIARVLDGGTTDSGRPYFVMELVRGLPITDYCDAARLPVRDRLALFADVCRAVQHAHQKGVIHRDIKPSNVLVTLYDGRPVPKVIDFGIAKAVGGGLAGHTAYTGHHQLVGTPLYMAPEQAELSALDVDTRADVYSLGVLMYELLTGTTPFPAEAVRNAGLDEVRRIIREDEPPRPSARVSTLDATARSTASARRGLGDRQLGRLLRGDLDWVAMKALEKDRNRRYESVGAFAADVGRYLADEPVEARPPSAWYRARKLVRRNRAVVLAAAAVLVALAGGLAGTAAGLVEARQQRAAAERAEAAAKADRDDSRALSDFLLDRFLHPQISLRAVVDRDFGTVGDLDPRSENRESDDRPLSRMLDISEERIYKMFLGRPRAEAAARYAVGVAWRNLGRYADAEPHLRRAAELRERELGPDHPDTLRSLTCLGETLTAGGRGGDAVGVLDRVRAAEERASGTGPYPGTVYLLALAHRAAGDLPAAIRLLEGLRERIKLVSPPALVRDLAAAYRATGRPGDANRLWADVVPAAWTHPGVTSINVLYLTDDWVADLLTDGQPGRAVEVSREYLAAVRSARPDYPAVVTAALEMHGSALLSAGRPAEAEPVIREVMAFYDRRVEQLAAAGRKTEDAEWTRALYRSRLGGAMLGQGRYAEAEPLLVGGYEGMRDQRWLVLPGARDQLWAAADRLAALYTALGRPTEAAKWWAERDEYRRPQTPPPRPVGAR